MKYAPIALFVYRRVEHTRRTLEYLRANPEAAQSDLIVFSDGAKGEADAAKVAEVRQLIGHIPGFGSVQVVESEQNRGLAASVVSGVTRVLEEYDRVIVLEDDMETAPGFLRFMNRALEKFAGEERITSIQGYSPLEPEPGISCFLRRGADCWGWGTWRRAWRLFNPDAGRLLAEIERAGEEREFDVDGVFPFCRMLRDRSRGRVDSWAICWQASNFIAGKYALHSMFPLVRNIGSGVDSTHCTGVDWGTQTLWTGEVEIPDDPPLETASIRRGYRNYLKRLRIPLWKRAWHKVTRIFSRQR